MTADEQVTGASNDGTLSTGPRKYASNEVATSNERNLPLEVEAAISAAWECVDTRPSGEPGSYARGRQNGFADALRQVRANLELEYRRAAETTDVLAEIDAITARRLPLDRQGCVDFLVEIARLVKAARSSEKTERKET